MCQKMLQFVFQWMAILQVSRGWPCDPNGANQICEVEYNTYDCQYDWGDCCKESCMANVIGNHSQWAREVPCNIGNPSGDGYGTGYYENCIDPAYDTDKTAAVWNSTAYDIIVNRYGNSGGAHKKTTSDNLCVNVGDDFDPVLGTWKLFEDDTLHEMMSDLYSYYDLYCKRNLTDSEKVKCNEKEYLSPDGRHYLTYCCSVDLWIIIPEYFFTWEDRGSHKEAEESEFTKHGPIGYDYYWDSVFFAQYFARSETGDIKDITTWYNRGELSSYFDTDSDIETVKDVTLFEGDCATAGWVINSVLFVIFLAICIYSCFKIGIKNISEILDAFEKQAARIEFIIIGICFGDSFIASLFISVPIDALHPISIGIILMFFGVINFICFALRMYITKAHILESESIGSFSDFSFDFGLGILFLIFSLNADSYGLPVIVTYFGVVEEFAQLFRKINQKHVQKCVGLIDRFLEYSGRVLATFNMFVLFIVCVGELDDASGEDGIQTGKGWLVGIMIWALVVFFATVYSWYAYVGCCGKCGGHKEFAKREDEATPAAEDKDDGGVDEEEDGRVGEEEDGRVETVVDVKADADCD